MRGHANLLEIAATDVTLLDEINSVDLNTAAAPWVPAVRDGETPIAKVTSSYLKKVWLLKRKYEKEVAKVQLRALDCESEEQCKALAGDYCRANYKADALSGIFWCSLRDILATASQFSQVAWGTDAEGVGPTEIGLRQDWIIVTTPHTDTEQDELDELKGLIGDAITKRKGRVQ